MHSYTVLLYSLESMVRLLFETCCQSKKSCSIGTESNLFSKMNQLVYKSSSLLKSGVLETCVLFLETGHS